MKTFGIDSMFLDSPSSVMSEMERLAEKALRENGFIEVQSDGFHPQPESKREAPGTGYRLQERGISHSEQFALTECEHGVHVDSPSPCKVCGAQ